MERKKHRITEVDEDLGIIDEVLKMKRMKTLEQIKDEVAKESGYNSWYHLWSKAGIQDFEIDAVAKRYAEQFAPVWVKCSDRLPELGERVLIFSEDTGVQIAWLKNTGKWDSDSMLMSNEEIVKWQPLPPLPQKD